jgi:DNA replication initiation complex subunit (GINS family)
MITYNDIYEALRKEKYAEQLQKLPKEFLKEIAGYIEEKTQIADKKDDMFSDNILKTKKQLENAVSIFKEMMLRRKKKLLTLAFVARETGISKRDFENMLDFEKEMFDKIIKSMEDCDKRMAEMLNGKSERLKNSMIMFREGVEEFMGLDGEMMGPYEKGELVNLPDEIAKILIEAGKVEVVEGG